MKANMNIYREKDRQLKDQFINGISDDDMIIPK